MVEADATTETFGSVAGPPNDIGLPGATQGCMLVLNPINETFQSKTVLLNSGEYIKIGRKLNNKTIPSETNLFFDAKVLSRTHAQINILDGKVFIQDLVHQYLIEAI